MSTEDSVKVVQAAYQYLIEILKSSGIASDKIDNFRLEELTNDASGNFKVTLSYDVAGNFSFDKKREYKDFEVDSTGKVLSMTIRKV